MWVWSYVPLPSSIDSFSHTVGLQYIVWMGEVEFCSLPFRLRDHSSALTEGLQYVRRSSCPACCRYLPYSLASSCVFAICYVIILMLTSRQVDTVERVSLMLSDVMVIIVTIYRTYGIVKASRAINLRSTISTELLNAGTSILLETHHILLNTCLTTDLWFIL